MNRASLDGTTDDAEHAEVGAYRLIKQIGAGGMGAVWLAEHALLGRRAAIKLLHPSFSSRPDIVTRFFNEARAATAIADPGIVQIFDFGYHDDAAYIVMELLDGETLDARCRRHQGISIPEALRVIRQVASSLGAAHARGIVHRDLKPENIFLVRDPEVPGGERAKILDFGIAKLAGDPGLKTQTSALMGTPTFMSPEQCRGAGQVDQRSDIYSLGCVLFAILVGRPPFEAKGVGDIIVKHLTEAAPLASSFAGGIPPAIDALIARCLEKDPACRFDSGTELAAEIGLLLTQPVPATPVAERSTQLVAVAVPTTLSGSAASISPPVAPRRRGLAMLGATVAVAITGIIAWASLQDRSSNAPIDAPPEPSPKLEETAVPVAPAKQDQAPPAPDLRDPAKTAMRSALVGFVTWSKTHRISACPTVRDLIGDRVDDPWGHPLLVTCTDQPHTQQIGVISAGPDGSFSTADDIKSWDVDARTAAGSPWNTKSAPKPVRKPRPTPPKDPNPEKPAPPKPDPPKQHQPAPPESKPVPAKCPLDMNGIHTCR